MTDSNVVIVDDSFESIKSLNKDLTKKFKSSLLMKYIGFLLIGALLAFSMYFDYKCTNNFIPTDYIVQSTLTDGNNIHHSRALMGNNENKCNTDANCGNGTCKLISNTSKGIETFKCECNNEYITINNDICSYHQLSGLTAFILSIIFGICGVDQCYLARGHVGGICAGIIKGLTLGGFLGWWIYDMLAISYGAYTDGNGQPLSPIN